LGVRCTATSIGSVRTQRDAAPAFSPHRSAVLGAYVVARLVRRTESHQPGTVLQLAPSRYRFDFELSITWSLARWAPQDRPRDSVAHRRGGHLGTTRSPLSKAAISTGIVGLVISFLRSRLDRASSRITFQRLSLHRSPVHRAGLSGITVHPLLIAVARPRVWSTRIVTLSTNPRRWRVDTRRRRAMPVFWR
jgi:hypothetical protein